MSFLRNFHDIVSDQALDFDIKIHRLLEFGLHVFALDVAIISKIQDKTYVVQHVITPDNSLEVGTSFDLDGTYCSHTLNANTSLSFHHTSKSNIRTHPCYLNFGLESYIGAPIKVNGVAIGTVNFSSSEPSQPFTEQHLDYIELFAQWLGAQLNEQATMQKLEMSKETLGKLERVANIGTWEVDVKASTVYWSEQTRRIHEVSDTYVPNLEEGILFYKEGESRDAIIKAVEHTMLTGEQWDLSLELVTAKGNTIWIATHGTADFVNGECVRIFGTFQDMTEQVQLRLELENKKQEAERALKDKSTMFAKMSHELRTPLNGVHGMLGALVDEQDAHKRQEKLAIALRSSEILLQIINEVLDYSKMTHGSLRLNNHNFLLAPLFADLAAIYNQLFDEKEVDFQSIVNIPENCWVCADKIRLTQIMSNLLNNAFKFTQQGLVSLLVDAKHEIDTLDLAIQIRDTGQGMSASFMKSIFEPFSQDFHYSASKQEGTGLGLSIVKELIDLMDGSISAKTEIGKGSVFDIQLKLKLGTATTIDAGSQNEQLLKEGDLRVLIVDDNEINRLVLAACLENFGIQPSFAESGEHAISKCQETAFDLIFMDCVMPGMSGLEATRAMRAGNIVGENTIISALTANTTDDDMAACIDAGMDMFIAKPFDKREIKHAILKSRSVK